MNLFPAKCHEQATGAKTMTVTREILTTVACDHSGGLMLLQESQCVFQNLLLFCFAT